MKGIAYKTYYVRVSLSPQTSSRRHNPKLNKLGIENTSEVIKHEPFPANTSVYTERALQNQPSIKIQSLAAEIKILRYLHTGTDEFTNISLSILSC